MKIISGLLKGMTLAPPKGSTARPTTARVRESVLNMLAQVIPQASFIDLFSGTGAIGLEALSRGAKECVFVEENPDMVKALKLNIEEAQRRMKLQLPSDEIPNILLYPLSVENFAKRKTPGLFDVIWADPPYPIGKEWLSQAFEFIEKMSKEDTFFVFETSSKAGIIVEEQLSVPHGFHFKKSRQHGDTEIFVWQKS